MKLKPLFNLAMEKLGGSTTASPRLITHGRTLGQTDPAAQSRRCQPAHWEQISRLPSRSGSRAFTLLELLVVIGIIVAFGAFVVPAFNQIGAGQSITAAADMLAGRMDLARHISLSENERVELRFFKMPQEGSDATAEGPRETAYTAFQVFRVSDNQPIDSLSRLPGGTELVDNAEFSSLLSNENPLPDAPGTTRVGKFNNVAYKSILFRGDGSTHLKPKPPENVNAWTVTLAESRKLSASGNNLPNNFATVMIDPITGRSTIYRP